MNEDTSSRTILGTAALGKGLMVLDAVGDAPKPLRFSELVIITGLPKGTLHRILGALIEYRLVRLEESDQTYRLGTRLFELAHRVWDSFDIRGAAEPELIRLANATEETTRLAIREGCEVVYIEQKQSPTAVALRYAVGSRGPSYCSGTGKAILAFLEPAVQAEVLRRIEFQKLTPNTITDSRELKAHLDLGKARGYLIDDEEQAVGVRAVGAPILDARNRPIAAMSISGPAYRLDLEKLHILGRDLIEACRRVSGNVGESAVTITTRPKPLGPDRDDVTCILPATAFLGEGPHWSTRDKALYWVDILAPAVHRLDVATGENVTRRMSLPVGAVACRSRGGLVAATQHGFQALDFETGTLTPITDPEADVPENRFNDGKCDRAGRFWAGTMRLDASAPSGALYRLNADGSAKRMDSGFHVSNGLGWSLDGKLMYFTESKSRRIHVYDCDPASGEIANRRQFVQVPETAGVPDGLTVDAQGYVWSANWDGWCVTRYDPQGKVERVINLPVPRPTSCVFGGAGLNILYITSARIRLSAQRLTEAPLSGSVFALDAGVRGVPEPMFAG